MSFTLDQTIAVVIRIQKRNEDIQQTTYAMKYARASRKRDPELEAACEERIRMKTRMRDVMHFRLNTTYFENQ